MGSIGASIHDTINTGKTMRVWEAPGRERIPQARQIVLDDPPATTTDSAYADILCYMESSALWA